MSFWISVYDVDPSTGERKPIELPSHAGGFHSWGKEVYASYLATSLGLSILPRLATGGYLEATGADLERVRDEARLLHAYADHLRSANDQPTLNRVDPDGTRHNVMVGGQPEDDLVAAVRHRLENIIAAVDIALALGPGRGRLSIG